VVRLLGAVPSGSYLTISHAASDISPEAMAEMIRRMNKHLAEGNVVVRAVPEWRKSALTSARRPTAAQHAAANHAVHGDENQLNDVVL
jgi:hypothetical protein